MPGVFSSVCVHRDDALAKQPVAGCFDEAELTIVHSHASRSEDDLVCRVVIGDSVPDVAAANPPPSVAGPGLRGHFERLRFEWLGGITRNRPEAPRLLAGFRVISDQRAPHAVIRAVEAHQNLPLGHMRRAGDAGLRWFADRGFPNFFRGCGVDGYQAAVAGADVHFAVPHGHAAIDARGIGTIDGLRSEERRVGKECRSRWAKEVLIQYIRTKPLILV